MENDDVIEIDLLQVLSLLYYKIWTIILVGLLFGIATYVYSEYKVTPKYQSSAMFYVNNKLSIGSTSLSVSSSDITASQSLVDTYIVILKTRNTLESVIDKGGYKLSYKQLNSKISASAVNDTEVFKVTVTDTSPERACSIATTIAEIFPDKITEIVSGSSAKIVDYAVVEPTKVSPNVSRNSILGALIGIIITCAIIILRDLFDDTIKTDGFLLTNYEQIPLLAAIPNLNKSNGDNYYNYTSYKYGKGYSYYKKDQGNNYGQK